MIRTNQPWRGDGRENKQTPNSALITCVSGLTNSSFECEQKKTRAIYGTHFGTDV